MTTSTDWLRRIAWLLAIWAASVTGRGVIAYIIRFALKP